MTEVNKQQIKVFDSRSDKRKFKIFIVSPRKKDRFRIFNGTDKKENSPNKQEIILKSVKLNQNNNQVIPSNQHKEQQPISVQVQSVQVISKDQPDNKQANNILQEQKQPEQVLKEKGVTENQEIDIEKQKKSLDRRSIFHNDKLNLTDNAIVERKSIFHYFEKPAPIHELSAINRHKIFSLHQQMKSEQQNQSQAFNLNHNYEQPSHAKVVYEGGGNIQNKISESQDLSWKGMVGVRLQ